MDDLHLVGPTEDGHYLILSTPDGERLRLPLDDRLLAAIRGDLACLGQPQPELDSQPRPAEIQTRIRAGETAESVALAAGLPVARVRRYEGPVLAERAHVAGQARRTPVRRRGDGFVPSLGEIVEERMAARGVPPEALAWDSRRLDDGTWEVNVSGREPSGEVPRARWTFDPRRAILGPVDEEARRLTDENPAAQPAPPAAYHWQERRVEGGAAGGAPSRRLASVPAVEELPRDLAAVEDALTADPWRAATPGRSDDPAGPGPRLPAGEPLEPGAVAESAAPPGVEQPDAPRQATARAGARPRRAAVPTWDDIVFGTRRSD